MSSEALFCGSWKISRVCAQEQRDPLQPHNKHIHQHTDCVSPSWYFGPRRSLHPLYDVPPRFPCLGVFNTVFFITQLFWTVSVASMSPCFLSISVFCPEVPGSVCETRRHIVAKIPIKTHFLCHKLYFLHFQLFPFPEGCQRKCIQKSTV